MTTAQTITAVVLTLVLLHLGVAGSNTEASRPHSRRRAA